MGLSCETSGEEGGHRKPSEPGSNEKRCLMMDSDSHKRQTHYRKDRLNCEKGLSGNRKWGIEIVVAVMMMG